MPSDPTVLLATAGSWHLPRTAKALENRAALGGLWMSDKNNTHIDPVLFNRCWSFHVAMKPFYHGAPQIVREKAFYALFPIWRSWLSRQDFARFNVVHGIMGYCTELFDAADKSGALKVLDCPNTHPLTYYGIWQRECDLHCPGERVPIPRWMFARMSREAIRADLVIVQSKFAAETMVSNGVPARNVFINPMGVDTSIFTLREEPPEKPRFVTVGTICLRKGFQYLFRAFQKVKATLPEAELICVGDYKCDFRIERPKWTGSFTRIPWLNHADLAGLLKSCTAFVFPSQEEGIARAQIEALASGLPVIGTHEGGATTLVENGVEGFIVRGQDPGHIAEAMITVARDRDLNKKMGHAAFEKGHVANSWQDYGDRLLSAYQARLPR